MSLTAIYTELHRQAARTGTDRAQTLTGGARIAVRVQAGVITLTISRKGKKVGVSELVVFSRDLNIPTTAQRFPPEDQGQRVVDGVTWYYVAYRFTEVE